MHNTIRATGLLALLSVLACDEKKQAQPAPTPTQTAAATASAAPAAASASATAAASALAGGPDAATDADSYMGNCPTAAAGAKSAIKDVPEGVEFTITGADEAGTKDIRDRVTKLLASAKSQATGEHNHGGGGRGRSGHCPVLTRNTTLTSADVQGGSKLTVKAKAKDEVEWLRRETKERDVASKTPGAAGMGKNHLGHCPSAVDGAGTKMQAAKDGVVLTVTAKAPDAVKEIRERAAHQVEIAKKPDAPTVSHNNDGGGGGALGRCPVVLQGDVVVSAKDVEGGSEISVKPKKASDVAALQKETQDRITSLQKVK